MSFGCVGRTAELTSVTCFFPGAVPHPRHIAEAKAYLNKCILNSETKSSQGTLGSGWLSSQRAALQSGPSRSHRRWFTAVRLKTSCRQAPFASGSAGRSLTPGLGLVLEFARVNPWGNHLRGVKGKVCGFRGACACV